SSSSCPRPCSCLDRQSRHVVECSFKDLTEIPRFLPPNASTVSLSANHIASVPARSFRNAELVASLWMTGNRILYVENGAISNLVYLRNLDLSHNKLTDFPWTDLQNLTSLQLLKLDHNELENLPQNAFSNLKELNSLRLNNNKFATIFKGTFDGLVALTFLQLHSNPFSCDCYMYWLKYWILDDKIKIPDRDLIVCASPDELKGEELLNLSDLNCQRPIVTINIENEDENERFYEGGLLVLTCEYSGSPEPTAKWRINSRKELALKLTENDSAEMLDNSLKVYKNGTLVISNLKKEDSGVYSCSAANEAGWDEKSVVIEVLAEEELTTANGAKATQPTVKTTPSSSDFNSGETTESRSKTLNKAMSRCSLSPDTKYVSGFVSNASFDDVKQYSFDFGVLALAVTETEAIVRLNSLLKPRDQIETSAEEDLNGILLCLSSDQNAVQWTHLKDGISTYYFANLRRSTNYSLCLMLKGEECDVQVHFTTKKRIPNLIIIISVSICLLTVSTVPLLGATCYHLVYKYRNQTYRMYLKARGQYRAEKATFRAQTESEKDLSEGLAEDEVTDSGEKDTEESILADSTSVDKLTNECEVESEYSDRLPLGAEADNITE
ncbi:immunoglobulin superfamily containing leucine-rich repeat protein 2-like, partial [Boleophthalmus pectinirostris]|uniref:immunoglobulin superfamily containing leucine-rich repeat protein 2-like n=1 Tax=Boleophthalmus pectinirostris TaxID=150288 RepID=UPI000A1C4B0E